jgi:hypothetical protein
MTSYTGIPHCAIMLQCFQTASQSPLASFSMIVVGCHGASSVG